MKDKVPQFICTGFNSPITEISLPLFAGKQDQLWASGTAVIIAPHLAITARHVVQDFWDRFDEEGEFEGDLNCSFFIKAGQFQNNGKIGAIWTVKKFWGQGLTDLVVLQLNPASKEAENFKWRPPILDLIPPMVGTPIAAFGYHTPTATDKGNEILWNLNPFTADGEVKEIYDLMRDTSRMPFPCYQTNARFDGGMSGGPVFNDRGRLCGIICSNLPPNKDNPDAEHVSYVTSLWPIVAISIDINRKGTYLKGIKYPFYELVRDGIVKAEGIEKISIEKDHSGKVIRVNHKA